MFTYYRLDNNILLLHMKKIKFSCKLVRSVYLELQKIREKRVKAHLHINGSEPDHSGAWLRPSVASLLQFPETEEPPVNSRHLRWFL